MCVYFTNLNKACLKDSYPLSNINHLVDNGSRFAIQSFRDVFIRFNKLKIHLGDEDKIAFITNKGVYYYRVMSFELKNVKATY